MSITSSDIMQVAHLSRLKLSDNEIETFKQELSNIMEMIDQVQDIDTGNIEPLTSVSNMNLRTRADVQIPNIEIEDLFSNVPGKDSALSKEIKCFIVPKVVE